MSELTRGSLQVVRVAGTNRRPNDSQLYVQVEINNIVLKTGLINDDGTPICNGTFTLPRLETSTLNIRLKEHRMGHRARQIGSARVNVDSLLRGSREGDVQIYLDPESAGVIFLHLMGLSAFERAAIDVTTAEKNVERVNTLVGGSDHTVNTVRSVIQALDGIVAAMDAVTQLHLLVNLSWKAASALYKLVSRQFWTDEKLQGMVETMKEAFNFSKEARRLNDRTEEMKPKIRELLNKTVECCRFVQDYASHNFLGRLARWQSRQRMEEYTAWFIDRRKYLDSLIGLNTAKGVDDIDSQKLLESLIDISKMNVSAVKVSTRPRCLSGTRGEYLNEIKTRLFSEEGQKIVWLTGSAGSGKSTIAVTISDMCDEEGSPAAYLFFERGKDECASAIRTIAYKLAALHEPIKWHVVEAIKRHKNIAGNTLKRQFEKLLLEPLKAAAAELKRPIIIILDALDESGSSHRRGELVQLLKVDFQKLPSKIRLLVTSRPEGDIMGGLLLADHIDHIGLDHQTENSRGDVSRYLREEMARALGKRAPKTQKWEHVVQVLSAAADGLFIWASTAVKMISESQKPQQALNDLLNNIQSVGGGIDELYMTVLDQSGIQWIKSDCRDGFSRIMGFVLFSKEAMTGEDIGTFLGLDEETVESTLRRLRSVLVYEIGKPVRFHHASFADYLSLAERSGGKPWHVDETSQRQAIAERCFDIMREKLRFNICDIPSSFLRNDEVPGLRGRIKSNILPHLNYASRFWSTHLCELADPRLCLGKLKTFTYEHLLYWFEVLSLTKNFNRVAPGALRDACFKVAVLDADISSFLWAAYRLAVVFSYPISRSAPHVYLSAVALWKDESRVAEHYHKMHQGIAVHRIGKKMPAQCMKVLGGHSETITSVAFSPDGQHIASGSEDRTIRVWDADTGELVSGPFRGHTDEVTSVAFSPDGRRIASGSDDKTILVWDADTGEIVSGPFEGHAKGVTSVAFSPDGTRIASCSYDTMIRVWDVETGQIVSDPFEGHTHGVMSVAFSPEGNRVASGSLDKTICVWDADTGKLISGPFEGHTDSVYSVAFSPNGKHIASGSWDQTIRVWDVSGKLVSGPFERHTNVVRSVAFSPDGKRIASGSWDGTIRVWDADSGKLVSGPFEGHTNGVSSVVFSTDGKRVVSGSWDNMIRVWDANTDEVAPGPFEGHSQAVRSVAFSPEGNRVASGSFDKSIRVMCANTGELVSGPFEGHTKGVSSVAFSPDGMLIASSSYDNTIRVWDADTGKLISGPFEGHADGVTSVAFSPNGKRVASGSYDRTIRVWAVDTGELVSSPFEGHTDVVTSVAFSPGGKYVASGSEDNTIRMWNADTGKLISGPFEGHTGKVYSVAFSLTGKLIASGSYDKTVRVWDAVTGNLVSGPFRGHTDMVTSVAFSPNGKHIVSGSWDETIRVWDADTGDLISSPFRGHIGEVDSVAFSPDGKFIASGSADKTIRIWRIIDRKAVMKNTGKHAERASLALPSGSFVNTRSRNREREDIVRVRCGTMHRRTISDWTLSRDGWVIGSSGELIVWIPEDMRGTLWCPRTTVIASCRFSTKLDLVNSPLGEDWYKGSPIAKSK